MTLAKEANEAKKELDATEEDVKKTAEEAVDTVQSQFEGRKSLKTLREERVSARVCASDTHAHTQKPLAQDRSATQRRSRGRERERERADSAASSGLSPHDGACGQSAAGRLRAVMITAFVV